MWLLGVLSLKRPKRSPVFGTTGLFTRAQKEKPTWMAAASEGNAKAKNREILKLFPSLFLSPNSFRENGHESNARMKLRIFPSKRSQAQRLLYSLDFECLLRTCTV